MWIVFNSKSACMAFKKKQSMKQIFSEIKHVTKNYMIEEWMVWIEVENISLLAWRNGVFKKVVGL